MEDGVDIVSTEEQQRVDSIDVRFVGSFESGVLSAGQKAIELLEEFRHLYEPLLK